MYKYLYISVFQPRTTNFPLFFSCFSKPAPKSRQHNGRRSALPKPPRTIARRTVFDFVVPFFFFSSLHAHFFLFFSFLFFGFAFLFFSFLFYSFSFLFFSFLFFSFLFFSFLFYSFLFVLFLFFSFLSFSFWWNQTICPDNFMGGSVGGARSGAGYKPPEGSPEGVPFSEASSRAKRSEAVPPSEEKAPPRLRRAKRGRAKVIGRSPLQKNSKRFHQKAQGNHLSFLFFYFLFYFILSFPFPFLFCFYFTFLFNLNQLQLLQLYRI